MFREGVERDLNLRVGDLIEGLKQAVFQQIPSSVVMPTDILNNKYVSSQWLSVRLR